MFWKGNGRGERMRLVNSLGTRGDSEPVVWMWACQHANRKRVPLLH